MNLCMHRVLPTLLVLIEATWGASRLQNFDAILCNKIFMSYASLVWRVTIILLVALPLGLSVAYKRFLGGTAITRLDQLGGRYGINFPNIGFWAPTDDPIYLQITAYAPFLRSAVVDSSTFPSANELPIPYGHNILLLNSTAGALLDVPMPDYIRSMQSRLRGSESWQVTAEVEGYLASYNQSSDQLRANDAFWNTSITSTGAGLTAFYLYEGQGANIGMAPYRGEAQCWISIYYNGYEGWSVYAPSLDYNDVFQFRKTAQLYDVFRRRFIAEWQINATSIVLLSGKLADEARQGDVSQDYARAASMEPFTVDAMPDMPHTFWQFVGYPNATWLQASYAVTVATSYWARAVYMTIKANLTSDYSYTTGFEQIVSARSTLKAHPLLYLVLIIQPLITILALALITLFYHTPIGKDFGIISILAGIDQSTLPLLHGASLSGATARPITLNLTTRTFGRTDAFGEGQSDTGAQIAYSLTTGSRKHVTGTIAKHETYW